MPRGRQEAVENHQRNACATWRHKKRQCRQGSHVLTQYNDCLQTRHFRIPRKPEPGVSVFHSGSHTAEHCMRTERRARSNANMGVTSTRRCRGSSLRQRLSCTSSLMHLRSRTLPKQPRK